MDDEGCYSGKKTFLLYPHSVIRDDMLEELILEGYETYPARDHERALRLLKLFPGSIMFINIDEGLPENEWELYIQKIQNDPKLRDTRLGILSYNSDQVLMKKYLIDYSLPCGYIQLKLGIKESTRIVRGALEANEARGRRKYIRVSCDDDKTSTLNYKSPNGDTYYGKLLDISFAGCAAQIENFHRFPPNSLLRNVQLRLHASLIMVNAVLIGLRKGKEGVYILMFDPRMHDSHKNILSRYIRENLQYYVEHIKV
jgi:hypothetical protein